MKKVLALLLAILFCLPVLTACRSRSTETEPAQNASPSGITSEKESSGLSIAEADQNMKYDFGVYTIESADGMYKIGIDNMGKIALNNEKGKNRFTFMIKESVVDGVRTKFYAIYVGDDTMQTVSVTSFLPGSSSGLKLSSGGYNAGDREMWTVEDYEDGSCRICPKLMPKDKRTCVAIKDNRLMIAEQDENDASQLFRIKKAEQHPSYTEFVSDRKNIYLRVSTDILHQKSSGVTNELMQAYVNYMQEAYEAEIELTGYVPYDTIVISGWEELGYVAGVSDNYNVINASKGFMNSELTKMAQRLEKLKICDLSFGLLHEMGHMFDSRRGWNFESEAWTDLKLCYVIYRMTQLHENTDKKIFGCSSADYGANVCHTYETMAEGLDIHAHKGAMTTVYGFFGAARLFLLMAYDFGWDPFIKTFHWYQDNGYTQDSFERWDRFTTFVQKLSEFSGKDIRNEYLTEENWEVFRAYYNGETTEAV